MTPEICVAQVRISELVFTSDYFILYKLEKNCNHFNVGIIHKGGEGQGFFDDRV